MSSAADGEPDARESSARRLEDRYVLGTGALDGLVPVPSFAHRAGRVVLVASVKRALLAVPAIRRAVAAKARRRASREAVPS